MVERKHNRWCNCNWCSIRRTVKIEGHTDSNFIASTINPCELWHRILAHVNYKAFPIVSKVVICLPEIQIDHEGVCKGCAKRNKIKNPFPNTNNKEKRILDIVHSYLCGPMSATSLRGYVCHVSFIDHYSYNTWIYFLKFKDEIFGKFM